MPRSYDLLVETLIAEHEAKEREAKVHKVTQMTPEETAKEIEAITGGVVSGFDAEVMAAQPKRRGRPKDSKNKPKDAKA